MVFLPQVLLFWPLMATFFLHIFSVYSFHCRLTYKLFFKHAWACLIFVLTIFKATILQKNTYIVRYFITTWYGTAQFYSVPAFLELMHISCTNYSLVFTQTLGPCQSVPRSTFPAACWSATHAAHTGHVTAWEKRGDLLFLIHCLHCILKLQQIIGSWCHESHTDDKWTIGSIRNFLHEYPTYSFFNTKSKALTSALKGSFCIKAVTVWRTVTQLCATLIDV